ncbi:MAG TPA: phosphoenolpyruvate--protein phosphotransferase [Feifaniaceae bacterium]|nr:phosphoenolpyruvate--protein phosphotransferase [Feifaniaceae bacterium]
MIKGNPVSPGIAIGEAYLFKPFVPEISLETIPQDRVEADIQKYRGAKKAAEAELKNIISRLQKDDPDKANIFVAHQAILTDVTMEEEIVAMVTNRLCSADYAIAEVYDRYVAIFENLEDELIRERAADLRDVRNRLLRCWAGVEEKNLAALERDVVVAAEDLLPSDTATLDRKRVLAILTEAGGPTSHSAIIARSYEIPAVLGISNVLARLRQGGTVIVDALQGVVIVDPTPEELDEYEKKLAAYRAKAADTKKYLDARPLTADGVRVDVQLNIGSAGKEELDGSRYTDGVGLFRTEFLYMGRAQLPTEEEQYITYRRALETYGDRPVILRTLDIGGDKQLKSMQLPKEDNPFLGNRALRLCFTHPALFRTQLRAALRASVHGNLWIMLPMVASLDDIRRAKAVIEEVKAELTKENIPFSETYKLGIMVEIPSIALIADLAAREVDFASIGTNDLCQYMTAVDRMNPALTEYYQSYHPAMFRLIGFVAEQFGRFNKPVGVCGELGGDPLAAAVLVGLGIRKLSMSLASVAPVKKLLSGLTIQKAEKIAETVKTLSTANEVEAYLKTELSALY